jgi:rod shape determining protein RodA
LIDSKFYTTFSYAIYVALNLLLVGVLVFGRVVKGSKSWIFIGSFSMQPSELAKVATSLAVARFLSMLNIDVRKWRDKLTMFGIIGLPVALILLQGDVGSAMVFAVFFLVLYREGLESYFMIIGLSLLFLSILALLVDKLILAAVFIALAIFLSYYNRKNRRLIYLFVGSAIAASVYITTVDFTFNKILKEHHRDRINVLLGKGGNDWNIRQSIIAIGSGGMAGKGYLNGTQTKLKFVPEQSTDFIFSSIGEEFGFLGSLYVVGLFLVLLTRLIFMAERQRSHFSRIYGYCVVSILFFHFLINIGMAIGLAPVIGIPLPYISYGGSSLLSFTILLFVFIRLDAQRLEVLR